MSNCYYDSYGNYNCGSSSSSSSGSADFNPADIVEIFMRAGAFAGLINIMIGAVFCFLGLKLFKCMMYFFGFCIGFAIGGAIGAAATQSPGVALLFGLICGIGGGFIAKWFRKVVYFIFGWSLGTIAGLALNLFVLAKSVNSYTTESQMDQAAQTFVVSTLILALLGGILAVWIGDLIVIITTATSGSFNIALGSVGLFQINPLKSGGPVLLLLELALFIGLGIWYQLKRREEWKGALEIHNTTIVNTQVNTNVSTENKIEIKIDAPQQPQYPGAYPGYSVPFIQNPYPQQPQQYAQPQQFAQPDQQYMQPQQYSQPQPQQYNQFAQPQGFVATAQ